MSQICNARGRSFAKTTLFMLVLSIRRSYSAMLILRAIYRRLGSVSLARRFDRLFDPASIRRHCDLKIPTRWVLVTSVLGERMRVNLGDHIGWNIFLRGYFDLVPSLVAIALRESNPRAFYLDIGANIGDTSIAPAMRGVNTVGVDASPQAIAELSQNVFLNSPIPYTILHGAVAARSEKVTGVAANDYVTIRVPVGNTGAGSVTEGWNSKKSTDIAMLALPRTVTAMVASLGIQAVSCIKLDVEGAEQQALLGMKDLLIEQRCPIMFEYIVDHSDASELRIVDSLPTGYRCFAISCDTVTESHAVLRLSPFDRTRTQENVLAVADSLPVELHAAETPDGLKVPLRQR